MTDPKWSPRIWNSMWRATRRIFDVDVADAERRLGLALRGLDRVRQLRRRPHHAHAAPAAAGRRLDDHRIADLLGELERLLLVVDRAVAARQDRTPAFFMTRRAAPCRPSGG
jgi:hypothetical protein